ncbi:hypothetical protein Scel_25680 [Streptomyces cellostaticus]|nr:hypothetical protein Scel_25680 [Streptomyces cellostaticus]
MLRKLPASRLLLSHERRSRKAEPTSWRQSTGRGVVSVLAAAGTGRALQETNVTQLGFLVSLAMVLVLCPGLRTRVLRPRLTVRAELGRGRGENGQAPRS